MDAACRRLEEIIPAEQAAASIHDSAGLMALTEARHACHEELREMETACRTLMLQHGAPDELTLEAFIDLFLSDEAPELQRLRRKLHARVVRLGRKNEENRTRLRAHHDVTVQVLQSAGLSARTETYGPGGRL